MKVFLCDMMAFHVELEKQEVFATNIIEQQLWLKFNVDFLYDRL